MLKTCARCGLPLKAGDIVAILVFAHYVNLKSTVAYSIDRPFDADSDTLRHKECPIQ